MSLRLGAMLLAASALLSAVPLAADAQPAQRLYDRALERERELRMAEPPPTREQLRKAISAYDAIVRRFPRSGYSDNALWQAGHLALLSYERFGQPADKLTASRLLRRLKAQYPTSSLAPRVGKALAEARHVSAADGRSRAAVLPPDQPTVEALATAEGGTAKLDGSLPAEGGSGKVDGSPPPEGGSHKMEEAGAPVLIRNIKRSALPDGIRVTVELAGEVPFRVERLENPRRVFFDLKGTRPAAALQDARLRFRDEPVREMRVGRHPHNTTRIVFDMEGIDSYSVFTLYSPFRLLIDFKAAAAGTGGHVPLPPTVGLAPIPATALPAPLPVSFAASPPSPPPVPARPPAGRPNDPPAKALASRAVVSDSPIPPALPAANSNGKFSLARQLGLGVSRVVIDAGHGGHDPGAHANGISEAELVLDVALRLSRLLQKQPGIEVVMTRDTDVFVPLEERPAIANREGADLFLSIHANASRNPKAHGVETYFLNFASNPDAAAVAARENSASGRAMHSLPDIVRAIAFNNKIDESRDFADTVQRSMVRRLAARNKQLKDLGVKQAPFVVLIGAAMPSVLSEISFVTHKQEGQLLKTGAYRQQIAEALLDAVLRYQQSLKKLRIGPVGVGSR
jgi:N-acetylmuramoyl-L-alanine amidase